MKRLILGVLMGGLAVIGLTSFRATAEQGDKKVDTRLFELRTYYVHPGKMKAMNERFSKHTNKLV